MTPSERRIRNADEVRLWLAMGDIMHELAARARETRTPYDQFTAPLRDTTGSLLPWLKAEAVRREEL